VGGDGGEAPVAWGDEPGSPPRGRGRHTRVQHARHAGGLTPAWAGTATTARRARASPGAHPRVGGDGHRVEVDVVGHVGLTPAWAGTAARTPPTHARRWAHPRVGGDGRRWAVNVARDSGSPPRGRGRPRVQGGRVGPRGAHPRVGGDGTPATSSPPPKEGSPPRGRGRHGRRDGGQVGPGLTPAWAGTAERGRRIPDADRAHPRVGGDGHADRHQARAGQGSPPRGRGRRAVHAGGAHGGGLTPAWAGTACPAASRPPRPRAHPRVGGDGPAGMSSTRVASGSPPRGRGRRGEQPGPIRAAGLTPAWAGTAPLSLRRRDVVRAHPRVGGDGWRFAGVVLRLTWAHPRVGGDGPAGHWCGGCRHGLTPAWAGTAPRRVEP